MAIKIRTSESSTNELNIVCVGTSLEGAVEAKGRIRIDGKVKGVVKSSDEITVGSSGEVIGDVYARSALIGGRIEGNVYIEQRLTLESTSFLNGNLKAGKLIIDEGAIFNGKSTMTSDDIVNKNSDFKGKKTVFEKEHAFGEG